MSASPPSFPSPGRISLGCVTFGREIDEAEARRVMDYAVTRGISLFDTAANYSAGRSEQIVGAWLASQRSDSLRPAVATKLFPPYTALRIVEAVASSAGRLRMPIIDLLYLHAWDETVVEDSVLAALDELIRAQRVRALGVSNFTAAQLRRLLGKQIARGYFRVRFLQNNNNIAVRGIDHELRSLCAEHDVKIITYSPLGAGFLTGKHDNGVVPGTRFAVAPGHQSIYFNETAYRRLGHLRAIAARSGHPPGKLALAWALHQPGVTSVLVGVRETAHLDQAFAALAMNEPSLWEELSDS